MTITNDLYVHNTLSKKKEVFNTSHEEVGLYCCGPTVYNYPHVGNLRTYIFEDILKRVLIGKGYRVRHVVNITDVGHLTSDADTGLDKMEKGAQREGKSVWDIAKHYTKTFMENLQDLNILSADLWPRATDHLSEMIELITILVNKGVTYQTSDGLYFDTTKFPTYADFAQLDSESLRAGIRIDMGEKKNPTDFALWKLSPKNSTRMMEWDSPWGVGFPGWHIECSAMSLKYLTQPIDIHCGGADHIRIHHTNEIAQVEAATMKKFVQYWLHGEFLVIGNEKMSKSKDGFFTLEHLKNEGISPMAFRFFCFTAHYRSPLSFSMDGLRGASQSLSNLKRLALQETKEKACKRSNSPSNSINTSLEKFKIALCDDLHMPKAVAAVWDILRTDTLSGLEKKEAITEADAILGLDLLTPEEEKIIVDSVEELNPPIRIISETVSSIEYQKTISALIIERRNARNQKDFIKADGVREKLKNIGVTIKDLPDGTTECIVTNVLK